MNCFELFRPLATGPILEARDGSDMTRQSSDQQAEEEKIDLSGIPIEELELSVRAFNCLKRAEINTLDQLAERQKKNLDVYVILVKNQLMKLLRNWHSSEVSDFI